MNELSKKNAYTSKHHVVAVPCMVGQTAKGFDARDETCLFGVVCR